MQRTIARHDGPAGHPIFGSPLALLACLLVAAGCGDESATEVDATPPARVTDLTVAAVSETTLTLTWTAPGDDGERGRAARYDVRRHPTAIDDATWPGATPVENVPTPGEPGSAERLVVRGFSPSTTAEFALRAADEVPNWSEISNGATGTTLDNAPPVACVIAPQTAGTPATVFDFDASCSSDEEDSIHDLTFSWDWDGDGVFDVAGSPSPGAHHQYEAPGEYDVVLEVEDLTGLTGRATARITVVDGDLLVLPDRTGDAPTIQEAIQVAEDGDVIVLLDGTYAGPGNRDIDFLNKAVTLRSRTGRPSTCTLAVGGGPEEHRGLLFRTKEASGSTVEGITFTGGWHEGGGIRCEGGSSPTIRDCAFENNIGGSGAGLSCDNSSPVVTGCVFFQNTAFAAGAAIHLLRSNVSITGCEFKVNSGGGAAVFAENSDFTLADCEFIENAAGAIDGFNAFPTVERCVFRENEAVTGGAVTLTFNEIGLSAHFIDCVFTANESGNDGGAVYSESGFRATRCEFSGNVSQAEGGAVSILGAYLELSECTFAGNTSGGDGGAVHVTGGGFDVTGCSLALNSAMLGGAFALRSSVGVLANTLIAMNLDGGAIHCASASAATLTCCDIWGNVGGDWTGCVEEQLGVEQNISADPLFCDVLGGDLGLTPGSPCHPDSSACGLIGSQPVGCAGLGVGGSPTRSAARNAW